MLRAELLDACECLRQLLLGLGEDNAEVVRHLEASSREDHHSLLTEQLSGEIDLTFESLELRKVETDHAVHGTLGLHGGESVNLEHRLVGEVCVLVEGCDDAVGVGLGGQLKEGGHCCLHHRVGSKDKSGELHHRTLDLRKHTVAVVDHSPPQTPSRNNERLREPSNDNNRDVLGERRDAVELLPLEHNAVVDLVGDDRKLELRSDLNDLEKVRLREVAAAGVGRVVDEDRAGLVVDLSTHGIEVALPVLLGVELVEVCLESLGVADRLVEGETRLGEEDVVARLQEGVEDHLQGVACTGGDEHIRCRAGELLVPAVALGHSLASNVVSCARGVSVVFVCPVKRRGKYKKSL